MKPVPRPFFLALIAYTIVLAAFVALTLSSSPVVTVLAILAALGATGFVAVLLVRVMFADDETSPPMKLEVDT